MPAGRRKRTGGHPITRHPSGPMSTAVPLPISEIKIDVAGMLAMRTWMARSGPSNCARASSKSSADRNLRRARGVPGCLVIAAPQPAPKPLTADGPGFSVVAVDQEIGKCGAGNCVKQVITRRHVDEHIGQSLGRRLVVFGLSVGFCGSFGSGTLRQRIGLNVSLMDAGVCLQSLRATLIGSMSACFHQAFSSPARCTAR